MRTGRRQILITGGNFKNQGAYMMLQAAAEHVRRDYGATPVIELQYGTSREKAWCGVDTLLAVQKFHFKPNGFSQSSFRKVKDRLPFVFASDIDAVFDVSGFAFGDQWKHLKLMRRANDLASWSQRGVPLYMLPQAFGPFLHTGLSGRTVLESSQLIFPRDPESCSFVTNLLGEAASERINMCSDFTVSLAPEEPLHLNWRRYRQGIAIVPNWNILERAESNSKKDAYVGNLISLTRALLVRGEHVFGLSHEGAKDTEILRKISDEVAGFEVIDGLNGLEAKWVIGQCRMVVSGRFHAIVSALSQGVPAIAHGWSHKYRWVTEDFGVAKYLIDPFAQSKDLEDVVHSILAEREAISRDITKLATIQKSRTSAMWARVKKNVAENDWKFSPVNS